MGLVGSGGCGGSGVDVVVFFVFLVVVFVSVKKSPERGYPNGIRAVRWRLRVCLQWNGES